MVRGMGTARLERLYRHMRRARAFDEAQATLWEQGLVSGELHLSTGEEAALAGVCARLEKTDAIAFDHRAGAGFVLVGVAPVAVLREILGREDGLNRGRGGHMHLFCKERLAASSGIVGSAGPTTTGFALAAERLRPRSVAIGVFGDGAMNQGMLLESLNLAAAWKLPAVFVCKDNGWAITTRTESVTAGDLVARAQGFGLPAERVDGLDPLAVSDAAGRAIERARGGGGPTFLLAKVARLDGHLLGDPLVRTATRPTAADRERMRPVLGEIVARAGGSLIERAAAVLELGRTSLRARGGGRDSKTDPLVRARGRLERSAADAIDAEVAREMEAAVGAALEGAAP